MFIYIYFWIKNVHIYLFVRQICLKRKEKQTPYNVVVKDICFRVKRCSQLCLNPNPANQCVTPWYAPKAQHFRHYCPNLQPWSFLAPRNMFLGSKDIHKHSRLKIICLSPQKTIDSMPQYVHKYSGPENPTNVFAWTHKIWPNAIICSPVLEMSSDPTKICTEVLLFCLETKDKIQTRHF